MAHISERISFSSFPLFLLNRLLAESALDSLLHGFIFKTGESDMILLLFTSSAVDFSAVVASDSELAHVLCCMARDLSSLVVFHVVVDLSLLKADTRSAVRTLE